MKLHKKVKEDVEIPSEKKKLKKVSTKKGVPEREDLQGKSKYEEFAEANIEKTLEDVKFPKMSWFKGECEDYKFYLEQLNIDTDTLKEEALDLLWTFTVFINYVENISDEEEDMYINDEEINSTFLFHFNEEADREVQIEKLRQLFIDNVLGKRKDFAGTIVAGEAKEREEYYEEKDYEIEVLTEEEVNSMLPAIPEVDAYDEELRGCGIEVIRDSNGRFLKGQQVIRKPKNIYSAIYPKLVCDTCYKGSDCPEYKEGYVCKFDRLFKRFDSRSIEDVQDAMQSMVNFNLERMQRMMMFEVMDGGMVDPAVTALIDQNVRLLNTVKDLSRSTVMAQQKKTYNADGSVVIENSLQTTNPGRGSILEKLFMNSNFEDEEV